MFEELPADLGYTVEETDAGGYIAAVEKAHGAILGGQEAALTFRNIAPEKPEQTTIRVTKAVAGEVPEADKDKAFAFTITIDGKETEFTLKDGESKEFEIPVGAQYEVREDAADRYAQSIENGYGTVLEGGVEVIVTNTYTARPEVTIEGEKTWELGGYDESVLSESITVQLKAGDLVVEEAVVTPDENGEWHYAFTAPKYDADGTEIVYTVEELPVKGFIPTYNGYDIVNTYLPPVEINPPIVQKTVEGENLPETQFRFLMKGQADAPMPEDSDGRSKVVTITGSGEAELGTISFTEPGTYVYTISELNGGGGGWNYHCPAVRPKGAPQV